LFACVVSAASAIDAFEFRPTPVVAIVIDAKEANNNFSLRKILLLIFCLNELYFV